MTSTTQEATGRRLVDQDGRVICPDCRVADRALTRLRGLLGRSELPSGEGLLIVPAGSVHTFFMRFPIDVVFLDREGRVLDVRGDVGKRRMVGARKARRTLELPAGEAARQGIRIGDTLTLVDA